MLDPLRPRHPFFALLVLTLAAGCATTAPPATAPPAPPSPEALWKRYEEAVQAAKYPQPDNVSRELVALTTYTPTLAWEDRGERVLMTAWTRSQYYKDSVGRPYELPVQVWLTAVPFLQVFCQGLGLEGPALDLRLRQRLGLPPTGDDDAFVEMWVDPRDVFRPCPDPEIMDHECQVSLTTGPVAPDASCPWAAALEHQVSEKFVQVSKTHLAWMCENWQKSYPPDDPRQSYPWTALGYTYDWGSRDHRGESEFVTPKGTRVVIRSVTPTQEYCAPYALRRP
jgi:hypothetical protein